MVPCSNTNIWSPRVRRLRSVRMHKGLLLVKVFVLLVILSTDIASALTDSRNVKDIGIDEKLGSVIPQGIVLKDESGAQVDFRDLLSSDKPTVLSLVYFNCPRVCSFATDGLLQVMNELKAYDIGKDFRAITVSFDPEDTPETASVKAGQYRGRVARGEPAQSDWEFLTGDEDNIRKLTSAVGFKYKKDGEEFAHPSALILITPEGKVSRYLQGIQYEPLDFRLSLIETSKGKIGTSGIMNQVMLFCYEFDPIGKRYALKALNVVKAAGVVTLLSLCGVLTYFWRRESKGSEKENGRFKKDT